MYDPTWGMARCKHSVAIEKNEAVPAAIIQKGKKGIRWAGVFRTIQSIHKVAEKKKRPRKEPTLALKKITVVPS